MRRARSQISIAPSSPRKQAEVMAIVEGVAVVRAVLATVAVVVVVVAVVEGTAVMAGTVGMADILAVAISHAAFKNREGAATRCSRPFSLL